jgi:hypothetical protein
MELGQWPQRTLWLAFGTSTAKVISVHNLDDPKCPVWMLFSGASANGMLSSFDTTINSIHCRDGHVCFAGSTGGLVWLDLIEDRCRRTYGGYIITGGISNRNNTNAVNRVLASRVGALGSNITYSVEIAGVPGQPPNAARYGLPDPVILVSTNVGLSAVLPDGETVRSSSVATVGDILSRDDIVFLTPRVAVPSLRASRVAGLFQSTFSVVTDVNLSAATYPLMLAGTLEPKIARRPSGFVIAAAAGLSHTIYDKGKPERSLFCRHQSNVMTGFMCGASTFALQATSAFTGSAVAGSNLITNGDFPTDLTGWTTNVAGSSTVTQSSGVMQLVRVSGATCRAYQSFATTVGKAYRISFDITGNVGIWVGTTSQTSDVGLFSATGSRMVSFIATSATTHLTFVANTDATHTVDNVNCREVIGDFSKSPAIASTVPNTNDFDIFGSLNRAAMASGCDVYGFSGFSTSNYLRSINTLAGTGTGDFHLQAVFVGTASAGNQTIFEWCDSPYTGAGIRLYMNSSGAILGQTTANGFTAATTVTSPLATYGDGVPHTVALMRAGGRLQLWIDGEMVVSAASSETLTNASAIFTIGVDVLITGNAASNLTIGMMRANMTAAPGRALLPQAMREELEIMKANVACLLPSGNQTNICSDPHSGAVVITGAQGAAVIRGLAKTATLLGTSAVNKHPNPSFAKTSPTAALPDGFVSSPTAGVTVTQTGSGIANGEEYIDIRFNGTPSATGTTSFYINSLTSVAAANGQQWFFNIDAALTAGALTNVSALTARLVSLNSGGTFLANLTALNLAAITGTLTRQAGVAATHANASTAFTAAVLSVGVTNGQAIDFTIRLSRPFMAEGASEPATYLPGLSGSASGLAVAMNDNDVAVVTSLGADAYIAARPLREGAMKEGRPPPLNPLVQARTADATATRVWQLPVYEGQAFMLSADVVARQYGNTITEYARYRVSAVAKRDAAGNVTIQNVTTTDYEVTAGMDCAFVADTTNQTAYLSVTGKASTDLQWAARVTANLVAPTIAA